MGTKQSRSAPIEGGIDWNKPFSVRRSNSGPNYGADGVAKQNDEEAEAHFKQVADKVDKKNKKKRDDAWGHVDNTVPKAHKMKNPDTSIKNQFEKEKKLSRDEKRAKAWENLGKGS